MHTFRTEGLNAKAGGKRSSQACWHFVRQGQGPAPALPVPWISSMTSQRPQACPTQWTPLCREGLARARYKLLSVRLVLKVCRSQGCRQHSAQLWGTGESGSYIILRESGARVEARLPKGLPEVLPRGLHGVPYRESISPHERLKG